MCLYHYPVNWAFPVIIQPGMSQSAVLTGASLSYLPQTPGSPSAPEAGGHSAHAFMWLVAAKTPRREWGALQESAGVSAPLPGMEKQRPGHVRTRAGQTTLCHQTHPWTSRLIFPTQYSFQGSFYFCLVTLFYFSSRRVPSFIPTPISTVPPPPVTSSAFSAVKGLFLCLPLSFLLCSFAS